MRALAALIPVALAAVGCAVDVRPTLDYPAPPPAAAEPSTVVGLRPIEVERPYGEILGRYGSPMSLQLTYRATDDAVAAWFRDALSAEFAARGLRLLEPESAGDAPVLEAKLRGPIYLHTPFTRRAGLSGTLTLSKGGRVLRSKTLARSGDAGLWETGWGAACGQALNEGLKAWMLSALPEVIEALAAPTPLPSGDDRTGGLEPESERRSP